MTDPSVTSLVERLNKLAGNWERMNHFPNLRVLLREAALRLAEGTREETWEDMITETEYGPCPVCGGTGQIEDRVSTALYMPCGRCGGTGRIVTRTTVRESTPPASPAIDHAVVNAFLAGGSEVLSPAATVDVNDRAIMSSYLDGCYGDVPQPVERILRQFFGSMLSTPPASPAATMSDDIQRVIREAPLTREEIDEHLRSEASPRVSAATPAKCPKCGSLKQERIAGLWLCNAEGCGHEWNDPPRVSAATPTTPAIAYALDSEHVQTGSKVTLYGVSAAERPAQTCATCKHDTDYAECKANWRRPIVGAYWKQENGCTLHEPGQVAQEKD